MNRHYSLLACETCDDRYPVEVHEDSLVVYDLRSAPYGEVLDWTVWDFDESPQCQRDDDLHQRQGGNLYPMIETDFDRLVCDECHTLLLGGGDAIHTFCMDVFPPTGDNRTLVCIKCGSMLMGDQPEKHVICARCMAGVL